MMPPSDSLRHQLHKLAEVRASRNTSSISTSTPTSTSTPGTAPPPYTLSNDMDDPWASPINIYIDHSITVTGDENTIMVSSPGMDSPTDPTHQEAPRLSSIAAVIIAALNRANALHDDMGYPRPVNIRALAGIRVNGRNNRVCVGGEINKSQNETADAGVRESNGRKRRASSEPVDAPSAQRSRSF
ncbi:Pc20g00090 [Penicillium rubens Wisconsin 54-1255]|uniref:Pc20g00090 protein n=1 Tax=Penicillium rubens (strain ATCC 28089 / DSM 1075 / NRRL 1951 / Wisconsin 54-1255) TaxID=500485 RepID=B6HER7_PENRW|nr:Pc20g00090 [Penicillium rubens Wisconsin 54-1255]